MASQLEKVQMQQGAALAANQTADVEIADILRAIAATLAEDADTNNSASPDVGSDAANSSVP